MTGTLWSGPDTVKLQRLYYEGETYEGIAQALGPGFNRSMVAGKVKRLKLPTRSGKTRSPIPVQTYRRRKRRVSTRRYRLDVPVHAHPLVRELYEEMNRQGRTIMSVATEAGVHHVTITTWRTKAVPDLQNLEACFNVLGLSLQPVRLTPP